MQTDLLSYPKSRDAIASKKENIHIKTFDLKEGGGQLENLIIPLKNKDIKVMRDFLFFVQFEVVSWTIFYVT